VTEPGAGSDPASQKTRAVKEGNRYVLTATRSSSARERISDIHRGYRLHQQGEEAPGISALWWKKEPPDSPWGKKRKRWDSCASDTVELIFEDCRVPKENLLGKEGDGFVIAMASLDGGRIGIASQSIGLAQACLDAAVAYAKARVQFGKPIAQFQAIRWMVATWRRD